ncbi:MAG: hypothetical protein ABIG61_08075 [Planctomycetota bacterium]
MRNDPVYKKLVIAAENYTDKQITDATVSQIRNLTKADNNHTDDFLLMAKDCILTDRKEAAEEAIKETIRERLITYLQNNFPDFEISRGREFDKRYITIWLDGKPGYGAGQ